MVLYSAVSSPLDRSKRFTLSSPGRPVHSDTVLGFSWKHSSHAAIAQRLFTHISTTVYSQVLIDTAESTEASWSERKCPNFETVTTGFEPGLSRLRVRHSTNILRVAVVTSVTCQLVMSHCCIWSHMYLIYHHLHQIIQQSYIYHISTYKQVPISWATWVSHRHSWTHD